MRLLNTETISIGDKEYPVKMSVRAMIEIGNLTSENMPAFQKAVIMFFCAIKAGGLKITYEEFLNLIDDHMESVTDFSNACLVESEKKTKDQ